jgi:hypothetical protein
MKLSEAISEYVRRKRTSGLKYETAEALFRTFLAFTGDVQLGDVSVQQVLSYFESDVWIATFRTSPSPSEDRCKLESRVAVRGDSCHHLSGHSQSSAVAIASLFFLFVDQCQFMALPGCKLIGIAVKITRSFQ